MARAETIQTAETGGGGGGPRRSTCCMPLPRPLQAWPSLLASPPAGTRAPPPHRQPPGLEPLRGLWLSHPAPHAPPSVEPPEEQPDGDGEEPLGPSGRRGALPDLLPRSEQPSWAPPPPPPPPPLELEVRRVAGQLRLIGDQFNATLLRRAHGAPRWPDLRDACRGLLSFITQTLSTLYRLT
ncbi:bcl-2-binding component 3 [Menidia menidia]